MQNLYSVTLAEVPFKSGHSVLPLDDQQASVSSRSHSHSHSHNSSRSSSHSSNSVTSLSTRLCISCIIFKGQHDGPLNCMDPLHPKDPRCQNCREADHNHHRSMQKRVFRGNHRCYLSSMHNAPTKAWLGSAQIAQLQLKLDMIIWPLMTDDNAVKAAFDAAGVNVIVFFRDMRQWETHGLTVEAFISTGKAIDIPFVSEKGEKSCLNLSTFAQHNLESPSELLYNSQAKCYLPFENHRIIKRIQADAQRNRNRHDADAAVSKLKRPCFSSAPKKALKGKGKSNNKSKSKSNNNSGLKKNNKRARSDGDLVEAREQVAQQHDNKSSNKHPAESPLKIGKMCHSASFSTFRPQHLQHLDVDVDDNEMPLLKPEPYRVSNSLAGSPTTSPILAAVTSPSFRPALPPMQALNGVPSYPTFTFMPCMPSPSHLASSVFPSMVQQLPFPRATFAKAQNIVVLYHNPSNPTSRGISQPTAFAISNNHSLRQ